MLKSKSRKQEIQEIQENKKLNFHFYTLYKVSNTPARFSEGRRPEENLAGVLDTNTMAKDLFLATQKIWNI